MVNHELTPSPRKTTNAWSVDRMTVKRVAARGCPNQARVSSPPCGDDKDVLTWHFIMPQTMV
jgi:hypothetical protein